MQGTTVIHLFIIFSLFFIIPNTYLYWMWKLRLGHLSNKQRD